MVLFNCRSRQIHHPIYKKPRLGQDDKLVNEEQDENFPVDKKDDDGDENKFQQCRKGLRKYLDYRLAGPPYVVIYPEYEFARGPLLEESQRERLQLLKYAFRDINPHPCRYYPFKIAGSVAYGLFQKKYSAG